MLNRLGFLVIFFCFVTFTHAQTVKVTPQSQNINPGQSVTVKIETTKIDKCTITGKPYNNFNVVKNGNILLRPSETTEYIFNCVDVSGKVVSAKTKVTIVPINSGNTGNNNTTPPLDRGPSIQIPNSRGSSNGQYSSQTLTSAANTLCGKYSAYSSVYPPATAGTGGGSVPVDLTNLASILLSIDRNTQLTANEFRQDNLFRYCTEYQNMARATARLAETSAKTIKSIADACYADERCMLERVYKTAYEQEVKNLCKDELHGEVLCKLIQDMNVPEDDSEEKEKIEMQKYCNKMFTEGFYPRECVLVEKTFEDITEKYYDANNRIAIATNDIRNQFSRTGVMGSRPCVETASGRPPEEVRFYEPDCIRYRQEPSIINEEALRQITALPYTQAFSPSSVLGFDGVLDNINTRTRDGNLVVPNISPNFGSIGGGTNGGGVPNSGTDLKGVEENYKKIARNIETILQWYDAGKLAYASSTYVCRYLPIATRRAAIEKIEQNKKPYIDYLISLKKLWDQAVAKPREDHSALIIKINFDLKDKYNQQEIEKVSESIQKLLKICTDARASS